MAAKLLHMTACPYCRGRVGEICVDLKRLTSLHRSYEEDHLRADLSPELNPFVFAPSPGTGEPCNHVILLSGCFFYPDPDRNNTLVRPEWDLTCDWWHAAVDRLDPGLESFVVELTNGEAPLPGGDVPFGTAWFRTRWPDQKRNGSQSHYYRVDARIFACRDAAALFKDLREKWDRYALWWNGQDPLGAGLFVAGYTAQQLGGPPALRTPH